VLREVGTLGALPELSPVTVPGTMDRVLLVRIANEVFAFASSCSHRNAPLAYGAVTWKARVICPWHLATFCLRTGAPLGRGPATKPIAVCKATVADEAVYLSEDDVAQLESSSAC
jgi:nitrite reductase/ring-hydroxylating ferredoxin subunit